MSAATATGSRKDGETPLRLRGKALLDLAVGEIVELAAFDGFAITFAQALQIRNALLHNSCTWIAHKKILTADRSQLQIQPCAAVVTTWA